MTEKHAKAAKNTARIRCFIGDDEGSTFSTLTIRPLNWGMEPNLTEGRCRDY